MPVPRDILHRIYGKSDLTVPAIENVIRTPIFDSTGELLTGRRYLPKLSAYLDARGEFDVPPKDPTQDQIRASMALLSEAFVDFPVSDVFDGTEHLPYKVGDKDANGYRMTHPRRGYSSFWNLMAMLMLPQLYHLLPPESNVPAVHMDKSVPGEGAGLLMDSLAIITTGYKMPIRTYIPGGEFEKGITSSLRSGDNIIGIDNIPTGTRFDCGPLAAALTGGRWKTRAFHSNEREVDIPTKGAQWLFAGNGFQFSTELAQRMLPVRLDSGMPNPAKERKLRAAEFFKHQDQLAWLRATRRQLILAQHTLIAAWFAAGQPTGKAIHPRFPEYAAAMSGVLELAAKACGVRCGFLWNLGRYMATLDEDTDVTTEFLQKILDRYGGSDFDGEGVKAVAVDSFKNWTAALPIAAEPGSPGIVKHLHTYIKDNVLRRTFDLKAPVGNNNAFSALDGKVAKFKLVKCRNRNPVKYCFLLAAE